MSSDPCLARRGVHDGCQEPHGRGLARAVRSHEAKQLALVDLKVEIINGNVPAKGFGEVCCLYSSQGGFLLSPDPFYLSPNYLPSSPRPLPPPPPPPFFLFFTSPLTPGFSRSPIVYTGV